MHDLRSLIILDRGLWSITICLGKGSIVDLGLLCCSYDLMLKQIFTFIGRLMIAQDRLGCEPGDSLAAIQVSVFFGIGCEFYVSFLQDELLFGEISWLLSHDSFLVF